MKRNSSRPTITERTSAVTDKPMSATARTLEATAIREGRWWLVRFAELDAVGQARTIREIPAARRRISPPCTLVSRRKRSRCTSLCGSPMKQSGSGMRPAGIEEQAQAGLRSNMRRSFVVRLYDERVPTATSSTAPRPLFGVTTSRIQQLATDSDHLSFPGRLCRIEQPFGGPDDCSWCGRIGAVTRPVRGCR